MNTGDLLFLTATIIFCIILTWAANKHDNLKDTPCQPHTPSNAYALIVFLAFGLAFKEHGNAKN